MLTLCAVSKSYQGVTAVDSIDLDLERGRTSVLIGPSGCGKSTLLRLMVGLIAPDRGTIRIDGTPMTAQNAGTLRRRMGYVIQDGGLFPHMTGADNVALAARHAAWPRQAIEARLRQVAELAQLPYGLLRRYPGELSGGQRQRLGLMRALMLDPQVLLLDEPLGALDPMIRDGLQRDLKAIFKQLAKTVVLVTHDIAEAAFFADHLVLMRDGRIVQQGSLAELIQRPAEPFVPDFIQAQAGAWRALREVL